MNLSEFIEQQKGVFQGSVAFSLLALLLILFSCADLVPECRTYKQAEASYYGSRFRVTMVSHTPMMVGGKFVDSKFDHEPLGTIPKVDGMTFRYKDIDRDGIKDFIVVPPSSYPANLMSDVRGWGEQDGVFYFLSVCLSQGEGITAP